MIFKIKLLILCLALFLLIPVELLARYQPKMEIKGPVKIELNKLIKAASSLHLACVKSDEGKIEHQLINVLKATEGVILKANFAVEQKPHIMRMMSAIKTQIRLSQSSSGADRKGHIKEGFKQIVQVYGTYKLDPYRVFFCSKDKAVWLQKSWKAQNPINPDKYLDCGKAVN